MSAPTNYHRLSIGQKQALHRDRMREPAVTCPVCETQTTAADLLEHIETRCPAGANRTQPAAGSAGARPLALGVPRGTLSRWVKRDLVRTRGERQDRVYLLRDLAVHVAARRAQQRRQFHEWNRSETPGSAQLAAPNSDGSRTSGTNSRSGEI